MSNSTADDNQIASAGSLLDKVRSWLSSEGYPTEFETAAIFQKHGFRVLQGEHVRPDDVSPREIDVLAWSDYPNVKPLIRCEFVVECKWSRDKPWVVFTSRYGRMAPSACITQTISSVLGSTVCWLLAGETDCHEMSLFCAPDRPGFGGRQAFSKGQDQFYGALSSVTSAATQRMAQYDEHRIPNTCPQYCIVAFPIVVIDGELFEATFSEREVRMEIQAVNSVRCHWRGAPSWRHHASIDLVTLNHLDEFLTERRKELRKLFQLMNSKFEQVQLCFAEKSLKKLDVKPGPRGLKGLPPLLREIGKQSSD